VGKKRKRLGGTTEKGHWGKNEGKLPTKIDGYFDHRNTAFGVLCWRREKESTRELTFMSGVGKRKKKKAQKQGLKVKGTIRSPSRKELKLREYASDFKHRRSANNIREKMAKPGRHGRERARGNNF